MKKTTIRYFNGAEGDEPYVETCGLTDEQQKAIAAALLPPMPTDKRYQSLNDPDTNLAAAASTIADRWVNIVSRRERGAAVSVHLDSYQTRQLAADLVEFADAIDARS